jgi:hypothetical protein
MVTGDWLWTHAVLAEPFCAAVHWFWHIDLPSEEKEERKEKK